MITLRTDSFFASLVHVVAVIAQRLPVTTVPKQSHVTLVRGNVVNKRCDQRTTFAQIYAPRVYGEERFAFFPPSVVVPTLVRSSSCHFNSASCRALHVSHAVWRALLLLTRSRMYIDSRTLGGMHEISRASLGCT